MSDPSPAGADSPLVLYTSAEVAEILRLNHQVVQRKLQSGEIPAYRIGREWRVEKARLLTWLERHSNQKRDPIAPWFDADGRLVKLPVKQSVRKLVLDRLAASFEPNRTYREPEVNTMLRRFHDDVAALRRELVMHGHFVRTTDGVYKLAATRGEPVHSPRG